MKIVSFVYCDEVKTDENGANIIISPLLMFNPIATPSNYSFTISFGVYDLEKEKENSIYISFVDSDGRTISENNMNLPVLPRELREVKKSIGIQFNVGFRNVVLSKEGEYRTIIKVNGTNLGEFPIFVQHSV